MESKDSQKKKTDIPRRPELDVINLALTWVIFLFHVCGVYSPFRGYFTKYPGLDMDNGPIREDPYTIISAEYIVELFIVFCLGPVMPMFLYVSGKGEVFIRIMSD